MTTRRSPKCPLCGSEFNIKHVDYAMAFSCPSCERYLCVRRSYSRLWGCAALLISFFLCFGLGARGPSLVLAALIAAIPIFFMVILWTAHFAPPMPRACVPDHPHHPNHPKPGSLGLDPPTR